MSDDTSHAENTLTALTANLPRSNMTGEVVWDPHNSACACFAEDLADALGWPMDYLNISHGHVSPKASYGALLVSEDGQGQRSVLLHRRKQKQINPSDTAKWARAGGGFIKTNHSARSPESPEDVVRRSCLELGLKVDLPRYPTWHLVTKDWYDTRNEKHVHGIVGFLPLLISPNDAFAIAQYCSRKEIEVSFFDFCQFQSLAATGVWPAHADEKDLDHTFSKPELTFILSALDGQIPLHKHRS